MITAEEVRRIGLQSIEKVASKESEPISLRISTVAKLRVDGGCPNCGHRLNLTPDIEMVKTWGYPDKDSLRWQKTKTDDNLETEKEGDVLL